MLTSLLFKAMAICEFCFQFLLFLFDSGLGSMNLLCEINREKQQNETMLMLTSMPAQGNSSAGKVLEHA